MIRFVDDDDGYLAWVAQWPQGHVVNTYRVPDRHYIVLHRSTCRHITGIPPHGSSWTDGYSKICSVNRSELEEWARVTLDRDPLPRCGTCRPRSAGADWPLDPGQRLSRTELHELLAEVYGGGGGQQRGGIVTPTHAPEILLFTDAQLGRRHGYADKWEDDGSFHYVGHGQAGDQIFHKGNLAIATHKGAGRALRLFRGAKGIVEYAGRLVLADDPAWYHRDAADQAGQIRKVIVFRLWPVRPDGTVPGNIGGDVTSAPLQGPKVRDVPIMSINKEVSTYIRTAQSVTIDRAEGLLVERYVEYLRAEGHSVCAHEYRPDRNSEALYCDLFDQTTSTLIEAKGSVSREAIRMAIGQLADYARFEADNVRSEVLLPERPRPDLVDLLHQRRIAIVYETGGSFVREDC